MKTYIIVFSLFIIALIGGFFYLGMTDVPVQQNEKRVEIPMPGPAVNNTPTP